MSEHKPLILVVDDDEFSFLQPLDLITKDVDQLQKIVRDRKKNIQKEKGGITTDGIFSRISIIDTWIKIGIK